MLGELCPTWKTSFAICLNPPFDIRGDVALASLSATCPNIMSLVEFEDTLGDYDANSSGLSHQGSAGWVGGFSTIRATLG